LRGYLIKKSISKIFYINYRSKIKSFLIAKCGKLGIKEKNLSKTEPNNQESCISECWKNERISKNSQIFWGKQNSRYNFW